MQSFIHAFIVEEIKILHSCIINKWRCHVEGVKAFDIASILL